jgi:hypothetical protein
MIKNTSEDEYLGIYKWYLQDTKYPISLAVEVTDTTLKYAPEHKLCTLFVDRYKKWTTSDIYSILSFAVIRQLTNLVSIMFNTFRKNGEMNRISINDELLAMVAKHFQVEIIHEFMNGAWRFNKSWLTNEQLIDYLKSFKMTPTFDNLKLLVKTGRIEAVKHLDITNFNNPYIHNIFKNMRDDDDIRNIAIWFFQNTALSLTDDCTEDYDTLQINNSPEDKLCEYFKASTKMYNIVFLNKMLSTAIRNKFRRLVDIVCKTGWTSRIEINTYDLVRDHFDYAIVDILMENCSTFSKSYLTPTQLIDYKNYLVSKF